MIAACLLTLPAGGVAADDANPVAAGGLEQRAAETYAQQYGVSEQHARRVLEIQARAARADGRLREALGDRYGGIWFDHDDGGHLEVGAAGTDEAGTRARRRAEEVLQAHGVAADSAVTSVASSLDELVAGQQRVDTRVTDLIEEGQVTTRVDTAVNGIVIETASDLTAAEREQVNDAASEAGVRVVINDGGKPSLHYELLQAHGGCTLNGKILCNPNFRGGTWINGASQCTGGFITRMNTDYTYRLLTAGHCITPSNSLWGSYNLSVPAYYGDIGYRHSWNYGYGGDVGTIKIEAGRYWYNGGSAWQYQAYPMPRVVVDSSAQTPYIDYAYIGSEGNSYVGLFVCTTSAFPLATNDYTTCGTVNALNTNITPPGGAYIGGLTRVCTATPLVGGSSGGPWLINTTAYGITSGKDTTGCNQYYSEVIAAESAMNVFVIH